MKWRPILDFSHLVHTAQVNPRPETYGQHGKFPPHVHFSQSAKKESFRNILITIDLEKSERRHFCSLSTPRSRRWSYHDGKLNYYCNSFACFQLQRYAICIGNSMICSDIWHKYHKWYFEIVIRNFTSLRRVKLRQFWNITSGIYAKYHVQIMLLFVYTTTHKRFVIFTCTYFKLSWNTTSLSQSNCRNFSCSSITGDIYIQTQVLSWGAILAGKINQLASRNSLAVLSKAGV